jgi:hypothetical protein
MSSKLVHIRHEATPAVIDLLESVTLGTNGAHYRHLDTRQRILETDNPLYLSIERNDSILANVTFCQRGTNWYIRYFAFNNRFQSSGTKKSKGNSLIKREIETFFQNAMEKQGVKSFYAYIDPKNVKSLWMAENFGFNTISQVATQTFSRVKPKASPRIVEINNWKELESIVQDAFSGHKYYFEAQAKPPFYGLKNGQGEIIALAKINVADWEIKRLPGKLGGILTKIIPFIPRLNKLIHPKRHSFMVPDCVWTKNNDAQLLEELFEGILYLKKRNLIIWWVDVKDDLYQTIQPKVKWGLLNKLIGVSRANVVERTSESLNQNKNQPVFTAGFDFI